MMVMMKMVSSVTIMVMILVMNMVLATMTVMILTKVLAIVLISIKRDDWDDDGDADCACDDDEDGTRDVGDYDCDERGCFVMTLLIVVIMMAMSSKCHVFDNAAPARKRLIELGTGAYADPRTSQRGRHHMDSSHRVSQVVGRWCFSRQALSLVGVFFVREKSRQSVRHQPRASQVIAGGLADNDLELGGSGT